MHENTSRRVIFGIPELFYWMNEENRDPQQSEELVNRYEQMIAQNASWYFDIDQLEEIIGYYCDDNKFAQALKVVDYAYTLFPENTDMMLREAQILAGMGHLSRALGRLKELERFESRNEEVLLTMASIYSQLREHQKAIALYRKALELGGEEYEEEINLEIALEYENMDRFDKAIETLQDALTRKPDNETLLYELAYCFEATDRYAECIGYYKAFLDRHPFSFPAWYNLGNAYQKMEKLEESIDAYDYCLAIQADFAPAFYNKAHALFKQEKYHETIQVLEESYTAEPPQAPVYCHIGECFEKLGEYDKALFYYRKSLTLDDTYADSYLGMGMVMDLQGRTSESIALIEKAVSLEPENPDYSLFLAEMLKKLNRFADALEITRNLTERFPENEDVWIDHADLYFCQSDLRSALEVIQEGWQKIPNSAVIGYRKVAYLLESGKKEEAEDLLARLHANEPEGAGELAEYYPAIRQNLMFISLMGSL